jgi:hypothetical protein
MTVYGPAVVAAEIAAQRGIGPTLAVKQMLDVGGTIMQHGAGSATMKSVGVEVDRLIQSVAAAVTDELPKAVDKQLECLGTVLEEHFDSTKAKSVQAQLGEMIKSAVADQRTVIINALLEDSGPLSITRAELGGKLQMVFVKQEELARTVTQLSEQLLAQERVKAERDRGSAKGLDFEESVARVVDWAVSPHEDVLEGVSTATGADGNKCGDHVIVLNTDQTHGRAIRIAIEDKARALGLRAGLAELDRAMSNREADAAIMVFASTEMAPLNGRSLRVFPGRRLMTVYDPNDGNPLALELACHVARALALTSVESEGAETDIDRVSAEVDRIMQIIDEAKTIRRGVNAARKGIDQIAYGYETLREDGLAAVAALQAQLAST